MSDQHSTPADESGAHRRFTRVFFDAETVLDQAGNEWLVQLRDISFKGMLVELLPDQQPDLDTPLDATIHLGGDIQIAMHCEIANREGQQLGLKCLHIDLDSLTHLRRLVELNVGDTHMLEREFGALSYAEQE